MKERARNETNRPQTKPPQSFETRAVHAGERRIGSSKQSANGKAGEIYPISTPIYASTTFSHPDMQTTDRVLGGEEFGYGYARWGNPTVSAFEAALADLEDPEGEARAFALASGMASMHAALTAAEVSGGTVLVAEQVYGSTITLLLQIFAPTGVEVRFFDASNLEDAREKIETLKPRAVVVESISNPLLRVADIPRLAGMTQAAGSALIVDNTFGTPLLQRPLALGADLVVHSATKYLAGHGDLTSGVVAAKAPYDAAVEQVRKTVGYVMDPFGAWLAHRGLKTLPLRMKRQCENTRLISARLAERPKVLKVHHPSLPDHPDAKIAKEVLSDAGGLVSFEIAGGREAAFEFLNSLDLCVRAPSLGDIYTIVTHPASASHRELPPARRERLGVTEGLVRLSVGIEDPEDILRDLEQALDRL